MAEEIWTTPQGAAAQPPGFELRPLSLGEVLDRTFSLYRARFWLFAGLGAVAGGLQTLIGAVQLLPLHLLPRGGSATGGLERGPLRLPTILSPGSLGLGAALALVVFLALYMLAFVVTQAAISYSVSAVYFRREVSLAAAVRATLGRWYRYLGVSVWQAWSMLWIPALVLLAAVVLLATPGFGLKIAGGFLLFAGLCAGLPVGVMLGLRNAVGVQAAVLEGLPVRASMRRSKVLMVQARGRAFVVMLLAGALTYAASLLQMPLMFVVMFAMMRGGRAVGSEIAMLLVGFVGRTLVQPVLMIGLTLIYFDQRVRQEGFDVMMLLEAGPSQPQAGGLSPAGGI
jgi:hypothetical protein